MSTRRRRDGEVLKFAMCLQIVLFLNNRSIVHFCRRGWLGGWGMVCGCHNCMIPNIKTHLDKKVTFLALVPVLQWNKPSLLLHICMFKMKSNLKHFESSRMTSKHTQLQIFNSSKYHCWKKPTVPYPELFWSWYTSLGSQAQTPKCSKVLISGVSFHQRS